MKSLKLMSAFLLVIFIYGCCAAVATSKEVVEKKAEKVAQKTTMKMETNKHEDVDWGVGCQDCHSEVTPDIFAEWEESRHGTVGFGCYICHGDGEETFHPAGSTDGCIGCHDSYEEKCGVAAKDKSCFSCHNGHTLELYASKGGK